MRWYLTSHGKCDLISHNPTFDYIQEDNKMKVGFEFKILR